MAETVLSNLKSSDKHNKKSLYFSQVFPLHSALYFAASSPFILLAQRLDLMNKWPICGLNSIGFFHKPFFKQYLIHNGNSLSFLRSLAQYAAQDEDFIKKLPHPNLLPEPYMAQEKGLSILIPLPRNDHLLIYERDLMAC